MSRTEPLKTIRQTNIRTVIDVLSVHGEMSRAELCGIAELSRTTTHRILRDLLAQRAVVERVSDEHRAPGRPEGLISINPDAGVVVGIELGRSRLSVVLVNYAGQAVWTKDLKLAEPMEWDTALGRLLELLDELGPERCSLLRLGFVGAHGLMPSSVNYVGSDERDRRIAELSDTLSARLQVPISAYSNTRMAAVAEFRSRGLSSESLIYCHLSRGLGSAIVLAGQVFTGSSNSAGEFGHMRISEGGRSCHCGGTGCVETVAGLDSVLRDAREHRPELKDFEELCDLLPADPALRGVAENAAATVGHAIGNMCNVVNPEYVVLGGELVTLLPDWVSRVARNVAQTSLSQVSEALQLSESMHGPRAASYGAALLALDVLLGRVDGGGRRDDGIE